MSPPVLSSFSLTHTPLHNTHRSRCPCPNRRTPLPLPVSHASSSSAQPHTLPSPPPPLPPTAPVATAAAPRALANTACPSVTARSKLLPGMVASSPPLPLHWPKQRAVSAVAYVYIYACVYVRLGGYPRKQVRDVRQKSEIELAFKRLSTCLSVFSHLRRETGPPQRGQARASSPPPADEEVFSSYNVSRLMHELNDQDTSLHRSKTDFDPLSSYKQLKLTRDGVPGSGRSGSGSKRTAGAVVAGRCAGRAPVSCPCGGFRRHGIFVRGLFGAGAGGRGGAKWRLFQGRRTCRKYTYMYCRRACLREVAVGDFFSRSQGLQRPQLPCTCGRVFVSISIIHIYVPYMKATRDRQAIFERWEHTRCASTIDQCTCIHVHISLSVPAPAAAGSSVLDPPQRKRKERGSRRARRWGDTRG